MSVAIVIMAGGRGERFWPRSRQDWPTQFLALHGKRTLLQQTVDRLDGLSHDSQWIVTRQNYADVVVQQLPGIPSTRVILEPVGRDTAACVALAALYVGRQDPDAVKVLEERLQAEGLDVYSRRPTSRREYSPREMLLSTGERQ